MRLAAIIVLAMAACLSQAAEIKYSRQDPKILAAYIDGVPASIVLVRAQACANGAGEERFAPDLVAFMAADFGAVQDPLAAVYAGEQARKKGLRYKVVSVLVEGIPYAGMAIAGLATGGVIVLPEVVGGVVAGASALMPRLLQRKSEIPRQPIPANWLTDGLPEILLRPGGPCCSYLLAMASATFDKYATGVFGARTEPRLVVDAPASIAMPEPVPRLMEPPVPLSTTPMMEWPDTPVAVAIRESRERLLLGVLQ